MTNYRDDYEGASDIAKVFLDGRGNGPVRDGYGDLDGADDSERQAKNAEIREAAAEFRKRNRR